MNIKKITIKNFLSLADVSIEPGKITQIVGDNGDGKTSILKALGFVVQGSSDPSLVKLGEDSAEVLVELSDETLIRRRINSQGRQSVNVSRDGMEAKSPQALLGALFDSSSFNPLELLNEEKRHEAIMSSINLKISAETLAAAIGVEVKDLPDDIDYENLHGLKVLDLVHGYFYQRRKIANKEAEEKKNRWETYRKDFVHMDPPKMQRKEIELRRESCMTVISQCDRLIEKAKVQQEASEKAAANLTRYQDERKKIVDNLAALENTISTIDSENEKSIAKMREEFEREVQALLVRCEKIKQEVKEDIATNKARLESADRTIRETELQITSTPATQRAQLEKDRIEHQQELDALKTEEKAIEAYEANERSRAMIDGINQEYVTAEAFAEALDTRVKLLAGKVKQDLMATAEMPIDGLEYVEGKFQVGGVSVDNLNTAAKMRLSVSVARSKAKKTKVICIDGAESLDAKTWQLFLAETKDDGFTYFVTKVGTPHVDAAGTVVPMQKGQVAQ
jgi:DNA repair exonuclease SbcCD ATPase subunit